MAAEAAMLGWGLSCGMWWAALGGVTVASDPRPPAAVTAEEADEDFGYQGEYLGNLPASAVVRRTALQVIALGDGRFEAVLFAGGLPGAGSQGRPDARFWGQRAGDAAVLTADDGRRVELRPPLAVLIGPGSRAVSLEKVVRHSPTLGLPPPRGSLVLFGAGANPQFESLRLAADGTLLAGATTRMPVRDFHLHLEFRTPYMPHARGQGRGNSGVYIQHRYKVQSPDSFGLEGASKKCAALSLQQAPTVNMCLPPLTWQTYDIYFTAARWDACGRRTAPAVITVFHNGVAVHYRRQVRDKTGAGQPEGPQPLPIHLQDHGDPVTFRNAWLVLEDHGPARPAVKCRPAPRRCGLLARLRHRWR